MQTIHVRRIFLLAGLLSLFVSYFGIWIRFINDPVERTGSDFIAFYTAGRIAQSRGLQNVYEISLQQRIQAAEVGFPLAPGQVLLYNHLPFLIPLLQLIVSPSYVASFYRWVMLLIVVYGSSLTILAQILKHTGVDQTSNLLMGISGFLFLPVFFSLMNGQDTAFLLLGIAIWIYGLFMGKEIPAGLGLSLTTVRPHIALFLAIPMLFRYKKVFWGFVLGSGLLALFSVLILGLDGTKQYINILLLSSEGEWYGMKENAMYNLIGLLTRTLPQLEASPIRVTGWIAYGAAIVFLSIRWFQEPAGKGQLIGSTVLMAVFTAPHLHFHDLALLLIPIHDMIWISKKTAGLNIISGVITLPIATSLLLLLSNLSPFLQYTTPYLIMLAFASYPYFLKSRTAVITPRQS